MPKTYLPYSPRQGFLLPPSPMDWLPEDHLAFFILDVVGELDLSLIYAHYEREVRGAPPFDPRMMTALLLYAYCVGTPSSRRIEKKAVEDVAFRVVAGGQSPDHSRISDFRRVHLAALNELFLQVLVLCRRAGLIKLGQVAIDGTKVKANASKHKAMSYERMKKNEVELKERIKSLLAQAEKADADEDKLYGKGKRGDELPEDLRHAQSRLKKIREAKAELEAEARANASDDDDDEPPSASADLPTHDVPAYVDGTPKPKAQRNFTDPDSRIQKGGDGFVQAFNCQAAVDEEHQIIVAQVLTNQPPDNEHFVPMLERVATSCGASPTVVTADAGYFSEENVACAAELDVDVYIATGRKKRDEPDVAVRGRRPAGMTATQLMARKLCTKKGKRLYARRKCTVEPVFGQIKQARGFRQFLMRGVENVRGEWSLICTTHNLLKLHGAAIAG